MPTGYRRSRKRRRRRNRNTLQNKIIKAVNHGVTNYSRLRTRSLIPKSSVLYFPYTALLTLQTPNGLSTENFAQTQFRLNDIFDPFTGAGGLDNITATGFQHIFGTSGAGYQDGIYQEFAVLSTDIEVDFLNESVIGGAICAIYCNSVSGASLDYRTMTNQPKWYKEQIITPAQGSKSQCKFKMKWDAARFVGADIRDITKYKGSNSASPANSIYLYVMARNTNQDGTLNDLKVRVKLRYKVECTIPRDLEKGV